MRYSASPPQHGPPRGGQATTINVPGASFAGFEEGAKARTLLRSIAVLDEWLEENEGHTDDEARVRIFKRLRGEALQQLRLELKWARP